MGKSSLFGSLFLAASSSSFLVASALGNLSLRVFGLEILLASIFLWEGWNTDEKLCNCVFPSLPSEHHLLPHSPSLPLPFSNPLPFILIPIPTVPLSRRLNPPSSFFFPCFSTIQSLSNPLLMYRPPLPPSKSLLSHSLHLPIPLQLSRGFSLSSSITFASALYPSLLPPCSL